MLLNIILLLAGFIILIKGAEYMVNGASSVAKRMNISTLVIGLTIVAFGTSAPELTVNVINSAYGRNEAIFGNIIGSNIFNLLMILGVTGLIYPLVVQQQSVKYEVPLSFIAIIVMYLLVNDVLFFDGTSNTLSRVDAFLLLIGFAFFMYYIYRSMRQKPDFEEDGIKIMSMPVSLGLIILGVAMLIGGGYLVTENAVGIAQKFGLSEKLIGLTILAVGTSLPELATSAVAAYKKKTDIAIGNVIGSNIFNIFFILGVNGLINPIGYNTVLNTDMKVLGGGTIVLLIAMFTLNRNKVDRWEAFIFLMLYIAYTCYLIIRN
ncbi:MAG: calcium/sodium antiporter [Flammeovirgaceae bacterium]|nr:MAG: calcium/sodium antiporter [Flammeovirgaceae bacterium]